MSEERPLKLGLDIGATITHYALTRDGRNYEQGTVTIQTFPALLEKTNPAVMACEYTGRLAVPYTTIAHASGLMAYYLHTVDRKAYTRLYGQTSKTDKTDSATIAKVLYEFTTPEVRHLMNFKMFLMTRAEETEKAWRLRTMLAEVDKLIMYRTAARNKATAAERTGNLSIAKRWLTIAEDNSANEVLAEALEYTREHFGRELELLNTVPGIADRTASYLIATLCPISRFPNFDHVRTYCGMNPTQYDSGNLSLKRGHSRKGSPTLRGLLYIGTAGLIRHESEIQKTYLNELQKGKSKKAAIFRASIKQLKYAYGVLKYMEPCHHAIVIPDKPQLPAHLISQSDYAKRLGVSRQAVNQMVKGGKLPVEAWEGKNYIVLPVTERAAEVLPAQIDTTGNAAEGGQS